MATATLPGYRASKTVSRDRSRECCRPKKADEVEGTTHAATGLVLGAGVGLLTSVPHAHGIVIAEDIGRDVLFGALTAGFALLPDADHPKASFAYAASGFSHGLSHIIAVLFGGHRAGMHSFFGIGLAAAATAACTLWYPNRWSLGVFVLLAAVCVAAALHATGFARRRFVPFLVAAAVVGVAVASPQIRPSLWWLVAMGMALHIFEDEFSGHGCALLWPVSRRRYGGDGHQPAGRRPVRPPRSGYQKAKARAARPVTPRPQSRPKAAARGPQVMCPSCWVGECESCKGQGCACPQPATSHPGRPARRAPATPAELPEIPPF
jgi:membrane-bound metal-dependent hydrolase YbcI (DUF457 family)